MQLYNIHHQKANPANDNMPNEINKRETQIKNFRPCYTEEFFL